MAKHDSERSKKPEAKDAKRKSSSGIRPAASRPSESVRPERSSEPARAGRSSESVRPGRTSETSRASERLRSGGASATAPVAAAVGAVFPAEELGKWRDLLQQRRREIAGDIGSLEKDAMEAEDGHTTPNHIAERGSDAELQDVSLNIAGDEKALIWQIDRALRKIDTSKPLPFGLCEHTRQPIQKNRLQLLPWTPLSIEGATYMETNGFTLQDMLLDD